MSDYVDLSPASEDYLETIYDLSFSGGAVRSVDVAQVLDVSKASVNKALGVLRKSGLIEQEPYGTITLTEMGIRRARNVRSRHDMLKRFLREVIGTDEQTAEDEACRIEHVISQQTVEKWDDFLHRTLGDSHSDGK